jgi:hypothetical protein
MMAGATDPMTFPVFLGRCLRLPDPPRVAIVAYRGHRVKKNPFVIDREFLLAFCPTT